MTHQLFMFQCPRCFLVAGTMSRNTEDAPFCCDGEKMVPVRVLDPDSTAQPQCAHANVEYETREQRESGGNGSGWYDRWWQAVCCDCHKDLVKRDGVWIDKDSEELPF